jgi:hypothetical protein
MDMEGITMLGLVYVLQVQIRLKRRALLMKARILATILHLCLARRKDFERYLVRQFVGAVNRKQRVIAMLMDGASMDLCDPVALLTLKRVGLIARSQLTLAAEQMLAESVWKAVRGRISP